MSAARPHPLPSVLVVAGSDSSGGAGLSRDVETVAAFGLRAAVTVTAVTVQTHGEVRAVELLPPALVARQMAAALEAESIGAVKIGMLGTGETGEAVASVLEEHAHLPAVLDPVLAASSGGALLEPQAIAVLRNRLFPTCALVTPNWPELARLTGNQPAESEEEAASQGDALLALGCRALLVKGGHAPGSRSTDILLRPGHPPARFDAPRLQARMRGTGCVLSSAIAVGLARGLGLEECIEEGKKYVTQVLRKGEIDAEHQ